MASNSLWGDADAPVPEHAKRECQVRRLVRAWRLELAEREAGDDNEVLRVVREARAATLVLPPELQPVVVACQDTLYALHAAVASTLPDTRPLRVGLDCEFYRNADNRQQLSTLQLALPGVTYVVVMAVPGFRAAGVSSEAGAVLQVLLRRDDVQVCGYQVAQDLAVLARAFPDSLTQAMLERIVDVSVHCDNLGLAAACRRYLGAGLDKSLAASDWRQDLSSKQQEYAALDAEATRRLACVRLPS
eukprot:1017416-Rhodomonas_salina.1